MQRGLLERATRLDGGVLAGSSGSECFMVDAVSSPVRSGDGEQGLQSTFFCRPMALGIGRF